MVPSGSEALAVMVTTGAGEVPILTVERLVGLTMLTDGAVVLTPAADVYAAVVYDSRLIIGGDISFVGDGVSFDTLVVQNIAWFDGTT